MYEVNVKVRKGKVCKSSTRGLYRDNSIPAVMYDSQGNSKPLSMTNAEASALIAKRGTSGVVSLNVEEDGKSQKSQALFKNIQYDSMRNNVIHIDFQAVDDSRKVKIRVPIKGVGTPHGVLRQGGVLQQNTLESEIICLPKEIPDFIQVDVSPLKLNEVIRAKDISGFTFSYPLQSFFTCASSRVAKKMAAAT